MKKLLLILLCLPFIGFGQITTTKIAEKIEEVNNEPYDSLRNFLGEDVLKYIGQDLYLRGMNKALQGYGFDGFLLDYKYSGSKSKNVYKCCSEKSKYNSSYEKLYGKYFTVKDVIKHPKAKESPYIYGDKYFLLLEDKESKDELYYEYRTNMGASFPFATVGYFLKLKDIYLNKKFVFQDVDFTNIIDGEDISCSLGTIWTCIDVTIDEKYYWIGLILENSNKERIFKNMAQFEIKENYAFPLNIAKEYEKKFGKENWHLILDGKVKAGFTEEMVRLSWGKPKSINRSSSGDQWVYEENYLYFDNNGIMTSFN